MGIFLLMAEAAHAAGAEIAEAEGTGGFGLNLDILESNLINLAILVGVLFYFGRKLLGNILTERRLKIETAIKEAEQRQQEAAAALSEAQQKLTEAQAEAQRIRAAAEESAKAAREGILAKAGADVERIIGGIDAVIDAGRGKAIAQLRQRVAALALERVESQLRTQLDDSTQNQLVDRSIALLGGR